MPLMEDEVLPVQPPAAPTNFPVTVEEFCQDLSSKIKLPEMIYAFSKDEQANGRFRDLAVNFRSRYDAFCGRIPV